jgi:hypothetical protein
MLSRSLNSHCRFHARQILSFSSGSEISFLGQFQALTQAAKLLSAMATFHLFASKHVRREVELNSSHGSEFHGAYDA